MTAPRRILLLLLVGLSVGPLPACLHVHGTVPTPDPPPAAPPAQPIKPGEFATLPSRPGVVIPTRPAPVADSTPKPPDATKTSTTTSQRPDPKPEGVEPAAKTEPDKLPILAGPPSPALEPPLLAAMRATVENRPDKALEHLKALDKANQDFVLAMMPVLLRASQMNMAAADPVEAAVLAEQLQSLASRMDAKAALKVERVAFCRKTSGFGRFNPWPEAQPYRPNDLAVLYVEVRHITSEPAVGPHGESFLTRAVVSLEVRDAKGKLIEQTDPDNWRLRVPVARFEHSDFTRSPLRDYSQAYQISVPAQPGVYTVTVEVKDPVNNRTARSEPAEFRVAGP